MKQINSRKLFLLFWLIIFFIFCILGVWQLKRYNFKKNLITNIKISMAAKPININNILSGNITPVAFQAVKLTGFYDNQNNIFLQNKFKNHQIGIEILTPVRISGLKKLLLVDRGWMAWSSFKFLPDILPVIGEQLIQGSLTLLNQYQFILGANIQSTNKRPLVMQKIDIPAIARELNIDLYPFVLRLNANSSHGFLRDWSAKSLVVVPPERHLGYAMQWFLMAFVLFIACMFYFRKGASNAKN